MRVTLLKCSACGSIAAKGARGGFIVVIDEDSYCRHSENGTVEPIVFAPLPSDSDREEIHEALRAWDEELSDRIRELWKGES